MTKRRTSTRPSLWSALAGLTVATGLVAAGCGITPSTGPLSREIGGEPRKTDASEYVVIDVNHDVIRVIGAASRGGLSRLIRAAAPAPRARIGAGDVLAVTVYEAGEGGLFTGKEQRHATFPAVQVDQQGNISLPYAGLMTVESRTPLEVQKLIVDRLQGRAIQPRSSSRSRARKATRSFSPAMSPIPVATRCRPPAIVSSTSSPRPAARVFRRARSM
jgi:polysaccharide export outer membrane protein